MQDYQNFENAIFVFAEREMIQDQAHDINHVLRVVKMAKMLSEKENARLEVVIPAAYLHDCFAFPKNHPGRAQSSAFAAKKAVNFLQTIAYPSIYYEEIGQAILTHSYSAAIKPTSLEGEILQDADRLDALGAIGIARCLQVSSGMGIPFYNTDDPFCVSRKADDKRFTIDHFYMKLLNLAESMNTKSAKIEAQKRTSFMREYLQQLAVEID